MIPKVWGAKARACKKARREGWKHAFLSNLSIILFPRDLKQRGKEKAPYSQMESMVFTDKNTTVRLYSGL